VERVAAAMAAELGWDARRRQAEHEGLARAVASSTIW
jgi:hypothetical protein